MFKTGSHDSFRYLKHKLWPKERPGVKLAIWLLTTKSQESTRFPCVQDIIGKFSTRAKNLLQTISIRRLHAKLWAPKSCESPNFGNFGLPLGSPGTKWHLDVGLVKRHKVYYKGEGGGFPQVQAVVSLVSLSCQWLILASKVLQLCTNHLVLVLCRSVWVVEACQFFLVPSRSSNTPLYPSKMLRARERALILYSSVVFYLGLTFKTLKELGVC
jgi:hypothetical protein